MLSRRRFLVSAGSATGIISALPSICAAGVASAKSAKTIATEKENSMFPRVFKKGVKTSVEIVLAEKAQLSPDLVLKYIPLNGRFEKNRDANWGEFKKIPYKIENQKIVFEIALDGEQPHTFILEKKVEKSKAEVVAKFTTFSLGERLFAKRPLKGEYHLHTNKSDGRDTEREMLVACCKQGYDFCAISDHKITDKRAFQKDGSLSHWAKYGYDADIKKIIDKTPSSMKIYKAEEVHIDWGIHYHNFGGKQGVIEWFLNNRKDAIADIKERAKKFDLGDAQSNYKMAIADFVFDKVHEFGGIAIYNHPTWKPNHRHVANDKIQRALHHCDKCDAIEVVNGNILDNLKAVALANDAAIERGKPITFLGNSDAHKKENVGNQFSIIFADDNTFEKIREAIKNGDCVAVDNTLHTLVFGKYTLTQYAYFLDEEYYPQLKKIREEEAKNLREIYRGKGDIASQKKFVDAANAFIEKFWQR